MKVLPAVFFFSKPGQFFKMEKVFLVQSEPFIQTFSITTKLIITTI